jgi:hypothetical protein
MQQNHPAPVNTGDGAIVGLLAGAFGAVVGSVLSIPIAMAMGPFQAEMIERVLQSAQDMPPEVRSWFEQWRGGMTAGAIGVGFVFSLFFSLFFYSLFGLFGGILGALMFRKNTPPPPPPVSGFEPPPFAPPSFPPPSPPGSTPPPPLPPPEVQN